MNNKYNFSPIWIDIKRYNSETKNICNKVVEELEKQGESLYNSNNNMNNCNYLIESSNKILNNMTWYGWFISFIPFTDFFSRIFNRNMNKKKDVLFINNIEDIKIIKENTQISTECTSLRENQLKYKIHQINTIDENKEFQQLEKDLYELKCINEKIGEQLDIHNKYIDKLYEKSIFLSDKTGNSINKTMAFIQ